MTENPVVMAIENLREAIARGERPEVTFDPATIPPMDEDQRDYLRYVAERWDD
jgi:hypothetical protein